MLLNLLGVLLGSSVGFKVRVHEGLGKISVPPALFRLQTPSSTRKRYRGLKAKKIKFIMSDLEALQTLPPPTPAFYRLQTTPHSTRNKRKKIKLIMHPMGDLETLQMGGLRPSNPRLF